MFSEIELNARMKRLSVSTVTDFDTSKRAFHSSLSAKWTPSGRSLPIALQIYFKMDQYVNEQINVIAYL